METILENRPELIDDLNDFSKPEKQQKAKEEFLSIIENQVRTAQISSTPGLSELMKYANLSGETIGNFPGNSSINLTEKK